MTPFYLRATLARLNVSYKKCGEIVGRSSSSISGYCNGFRPIPKEVERKITDFAKANGVLCHEVTWPSAPLDLAEQRRVLDEHELEMAITQRIHYLVSSDARAQQILKEASCH